MVEMLSTAPQIVVVAEAADGREAVDLARKQEPDVVVLDVQMPVMGGQVALRKLLDLRPRPKVVIVTVFADEAHVREMLVHGASAYLSKNASMGDLISTVHSVAQRDQEEEGTGKDAIVFVSRETFEKQGVSRRNFLSRRETEILTLAARALSNREIAETLHLSEGTVKRHLSNVYEKLDVGTRAEAARKALAEGWISTWDVLRED